jgi:hypothetical protein
VNVCQIGHVETGGFWWCPVENGADREIDDDLLLAACAPARRGATEDRCGMFNLCDVPAVHADLHHADRE